MRARCVAMVACVLLSASCSAGPSLGDAVAELRKDTRTLETDDVFKNPLKKLTILERPDKDVPCGEGRFKRVMRATADYERAAGQTVDAYLNLAQSLMEDTLSLPRFGYTVTSDPGRRDKPAARVIRGVKDEAGVTMTVDVRPDSPTWSIRAETGCFAS
ncbi:hypothetical protein AB0C27_29940 [Nonomuraea sp. NPDC048882]|uniref:hypothetical protein n=1 Tax=unclassified Nonomuraea TaxID=2593643 RepID=UPI000AD41AD3